MSCQKSNFSLTSGLILLITLVGPATIQMIFNASSMAVGIAVVASLHIFIMVISARFGSYFRFSRRLTFLVFAILCIILLQGFISFIMKDAFDLKRFLQSYIFLILYILGVLSFLKLAITISCAQADMAIKFVFYVLLLTATLSLLNFSPFSSNQNNPVFFFSEPSHFAIVFLPLLLYITIRSESTSFIFFIFLLMYLVVLVLQSLVLIIGITFILFISVRLSKIIIFTPIAIALIFINLEGLDYYISRVQLSSESQNLSVLAYLSGWERAYLNFKETYGLGVGFQQFGIVGSRGDIQEILRTNSAPDLNLMDGGALATKLIGEFGALGIVALALYLTYFINVLSQLRKQVLGGTKHQIGLSIFFLSSFVMYFIELFFRGVGYFSPSGYIFIASIVWLYSHRPSN